MNQFGRQRNQMIYYHKMCKKKQKKNNRIKLITTIYESMQTTGNNKINFASAQQLINSQNTQKKSVYTGKSNLSRSHEIKIPFCKIINITSFFVRI